MSSASSSSFFAERDTSKSKGSSKNKASHIRPSGIGYVQTVVGSLISAANDTSETVSNEISESLVEIGRHKPSTVLDIASQFLDKNKRLPKNHRVILLRTMTRICDLRSDFILENIALAETLTNLAVAEMTADKDIHSAWQGAACDLLTQLSILHPNPVAVSLCDRISPGAVPHYFVLKALADFAQANPRGLVERLREIIAKVLPVMGLVKHDNMRWIFAYSMGKFAEAVLFYISNTDGVTLGTLDFSENMFAAFEVVLNQWTVNRELKVRLACAEALGQLARVVPPTMLNQVADHVCQTLVGYFRKERRGDMLPVSMGMSGFLEAMCEESLGRDTLLANSHSMLNAILTTIHPLACMPASLEEPSTMKTNHELLRCFETLCRRFPSEIINFLRRQYESREPHIRGGTSAIFRHCITRSPAELAGSRDEILSCVMPQVGEGNWNALMDLLQLVAVMGSEGFLALNGGQTLVDFVFRMACLPQQVVDQSNAEAQRSKNRSAVVAQDVRAGAVSILVVFITTHALLDDVLWPSILEKLARAECVEGGAILMQCISTLGLKKRLTDDHLYYIDFDKQVNLPKPTRLLARILSEISVLKRKGNVVRHALATLKALGPILHPSAAEYWDEVVPQMQIALEETEDEEEWLDRVCHMIFDTIGTVGEEEWSGSLAHSLVEQVEAYGRCFEWQMLRRGAFACLGAVLQKTGKRDAINSCLAQAVELASPEVPEEREGVAKALGLASVTQMDAVFERLHCTLMPQKPKGGGFFSKFKSAKGPSDEVKSMVLVCYGQVAQHLPSELLRSRVDVHIMDKVLDLLCDPKNPVSVKVAGLHAIKNVAEAMHQDRMQQSFAPLQRREEVVRKVLEVLGANAKLQDKAKAPIILKLRCDCLEAITSLLRLDPKWGNAWVREIFDFSVALLDIPTAVFAAEPATEKQLLDLWFSTLGELVVRSEDGICATMHMLVDLLDSRIRHREAFIRGRAMNAVVHVLKVLAKAAGGVLAREGADAVNEIAKVFEAGLGAHIGAIAARCTDPELEVRIASADSLYLLFRIHNFLLAGPKADLPDELIKLQALRSNMEVEDSRELFAIAKEVSNATGVLTPEPQLRSMIDSLMQSLNDSEVDVGNGVCVVVNGVLRLRGRELESDVFNFITALVDTLPTLEHRDQTVNGVLHAVRALARHHLIAVTNAMLCFTRPHPPHVVKAIQVLAGDAACQEDLLNHLLDTVNNSQHFEDYRHSTSSDAKLRQESSSSASVTKPGVCMDTNLMKREFSKQVLPTLKPLTAISALSCFCSIEETNEIVRTKDVEILCTCLLHFGISHMCLDKTIATDASDTLRSFFVALDEEKILETMEHDGLWEKLVDWESYLPAAAQVMGLFCQSILTEREADGLLDVLRRSYRYLLEYTKRAEEGHRISSTCLIGEITSHVEDDRMLLQNCINVMLGKMGDPSLLVRMQAIKGAGNLAASSLDDVNRLATPVISALMGFIESKEDELILESLDSLAKIFDNVSEEFVSPVLVNVCLRLKPAFENENEKIRANAFTLFGTLSNFGKGSDAFMEQLHSSLPSLLVHTNDESLDVRKASKQATRRLTALLEFPSLQELVDSKAFDPDIVLDFEDFMPKVARELASFYPSSEANLFLMTLITFFQSRWHQIRENAVLLTGFVLFHLSEEAKARINLEHICSAMISLLNEPDPKVRQACAKALAVLHEV